MKIPLQDAYGTVWIHLLPFLRPAVVRHALPERAEEVMCTADAVRIALEQDLVDEQDRNVILAHQFVTGGKNDVMQKNCRLATWIRFRQNCLKSLIMLHWGTSTAHRRWKETRFAIAVRR